MKIFEQIDRNLEFSVHLCPGAKKQDILCTLNGTLKVSVHAKPTENQANLALIKFLSDKFKVAKSRIHIKYGNKSRNKRVIISDFSINEIPEEIISKIN